MMFFVICIGILLLICYNSMNSSPLSVDEQIIKETEWPNLSYSAGVKTKNSNSRYKCYSFNIYFFLSWILLLKVFYRCLKDKVWSCSFNRKNAKVMAMMTVEVNILCCHMGADDNNFLRKLTHKMPNWLWSLHHPFFSNRLLPCNWEIGGRVTIC